MKYSYNRFIHLLIVIGSMIALEILAARHFNNVLSMSSSLPANQTVTPVISAVNRGNEIDIHATSLSQTDTGVQSSDTKEENWATTKSIIKIIL
jgi:hypothetical protein